MKRILSLLRKILFILLIIFCIFIGGIIIAAISHPSSNNPEVQGFYVGEGITYATIIALIIWAIVGSYKKWVRKSRVTKV